MARKKWGALRRSLNSLQRLADKIFLGLAQLDARVDGAPPVKHKRKPKAEKAIPVVVAKATPEEVAESEDTAEAIGALAGMIDAGVIQPNDHLPLPADGIDFEDEDDEDEDEVPTAKSDADDDGPHINTVEEEEDDVRKAVILVRPVSTAPFTWWPKLSNGEFRWATIEAVGTAYAGYHMGYDEKYAMTLEVAESVVDGFIDDRTDKNAAKINMQAARDEAERLWELSMESL